MVIINISVTVIVTLTLTLTLTLALVLTQQRLAARFPRGIRARCFLRVTANPHALH